MRGTPKGHWAGPNAPQNDRVPAPSLRCTGVCKAMGTRLCQGSGSQGGSVNQGFQAEAQEPLQREGAHVTLQPHCSPTNPQRLGRDLPPPWRSLASPVITTGSATEQFCQQHIHPEDTPPLLEGFGLWPWNSRSSLLLWGRVHWRAAVRARWPSVALVLGSAPPPGQGHTEASHLCRCGLGRGKALGFPRTHPWEVVWGLHPFRTRTCPSPGGWRPQGGRWGCLRSRVQWAGPP